MSATTRNIQSIQCDTSFHRSDTRTCVASRARRAPPVGSNIYNILAVLGLSAILAPDGITVAPAAVSFDIPVMVAVALACLPIFATGHLIARWEGFLFVGYYAAYALYLVLASLEHDALPLFSATMIAYVLPLTAVTLLVLYVRAARRP